MEYPESAMTGQHPNDRLPPFRDLWQRAEETERRFLQTGDLAALDEAVAETGAPADLRRSIETFERALQRASQDDPVLPAVLDHLAIGWRSLYEATGDPEAMEHALGFIDRGLALAPPPAPVRLTLLTGLGLARIALYDRDGKGCGSFGTAKFPCIFREIGRFCWVEGTDLAGLMSRREA